LDHFVPWTVRIAQELYGLLDTLHVASLGLMPAANFLLCCPSQLRWANWRHCAPAQRLILNPEWVHLSFQDFRWFPISNREKEERKAGDILDTVIDDLE